MKRSSVVEVILNIALLAACGCGAQLVDPICNVSIGSVQSTIAKNSDCLFPALVTLPDGHLIAAEECNGAIMTQMSTDKGVTWKPNAPVYFENYPASVFAISLLANGKLFLGTSVTASVGIPAYVLGTIGTGDVIQWSKPVLIETPGYIAGCWGVSPLVRAANGDLLWPVWCYNNTTGKLPGTSTVLVSKDGGVTWPEQIIVGNPVVDGRDYDEGAAVAYPNGDIVMIIRHTPSLAEEPKGSWWRSKSVDSGLTWSSPVKVADLGIVGRPTLALLPSGGLVLLGRGKIGGVSTTAYATSRDEGITFGWFADLEKASNTWKFDEYDAMSLLPDGTIGVVTSHNTHGDGNFLAGTYDTDYSSLVDNCPQEGASVTKQSALLTILPCVFKKH
jgi:hypothetical protein